MQKELTMFQQPHAILTADPPGDDAADLATLEELVPGTLAYGQRRDGTGRWRLNKSELRPGPSEEYRFVVPIHGAWLLAARLEKLGMAYDVDTRHETPDPWQDARKDEWAAEAKPRVRALAAAGVLRPGVADMLTSYQLANVTFGNSRPWLYNVWPCGSGKTLGALITALVHGGTILVVCPGKARATWQREILKRTTLEPFRKRPTASMRKSDQTFAEYQEAHPTGGIYIYGAEALPLYIEEIQKIDPTVVIFDELHLFGSRKRWDAEVQPDGSVTFKQAMSKAGSRVKLSVAGAVCSRLRNIKLAIGLSATPLDDGRPRRLWSQLDMLSPGGFSFSYYRFAKRYCGGRPGEYGFDDKGSSNLQELKLRARFLMHEVTYSESHGELPPTRVEVEYLDRSEQTRPERWSDDETYGQAAKRMAKQAAKGQIPKESVVEARLAEACSRKRRYVVDEAMQGLRGGGKVLIFATRHREVEAIARALRRAVTTGDSAIQSVTVLMAHGGVSERERDKMVERYRDSDGPIVMVATGQTMGTSVDGFQTTTLGLLAMLPWKPGDFTQWRGRFDRLGGAATLLKVIVARGTYDEKVVEILTDKLGPIEALLKDETVTSVKDKLLGIDDEEAVLAGIMGKLF